MIIAIVITQRAEKVEARLALEREELSGLQVREWTAVAVVHGKRTVLTGICLRLFRSRNFW
eukprot:SAG25_NODE_7032_length_511_cov_0.740291_2_plen_61_part_00